MCENFLQRFEDYAGDDIEDLDKSEMKLIAFCKTVKDPKDESFVSFHRAQVPSQYIYIITLH